MKLSSLRYVLLRVLPAVLQLSCLYVGRVEARDRLVVHEWGTFTALQDDDGTALAGINVDDEPLPAFVHNLAPQALARPTGLQDHLAKGAPQRHPYVTLRLETPVVYFYPPADAARPLSLDVHVDFHGGWLTQFYPGAEALAPGLKEGNFHFGSIGPATHSSLDWAGLRLGTRDAVPETAERVWLAPRKTSAATLTADCGESEKYLFYRGVGNLAAPLKVVSDLRQDRLKLYANFADVLAGPQAVQVGPLWLVEVRPGGQVAFRTLPLAAASAASEPPLQGAPRGFDTADFSRANLSRLEQSIEAALVAGGLYEDEAAAMLATWHQAYFLSPGLRLFCVVPRPWTDHYLPLRISEPCDLKRVMVARIELVSPRQRDLLSALRQMKLSDLQWLVEARRSPNFGRFAAGRSDFGDLGVELPPEVQTYWELGRFRNALVIAEQAQRPSDELAHFIHVFGLESYDWSHTAGGGR